MTNDQAPMTKGSTGIYPGVWDLLSGGLVSGDRVKTRYTQWKFGVSPQFEMVKEHGYVCSDGKAI
jgi:hypothetical protein